MLKKEIKGDTMDYLIFLVTILGIATIILNVLILSKLGRSSIRRFGSQVFGLMLIFLIAGLLRSNQALFENEYPEMFIYVEYAMYSITYIAASYKLYQMTEIYGFNMD